MKYLGVLIVLVIISLFLTRQAPVASVKEAIVQSEAAPLSEGGREPAPPAGSSLKQPFDRTHAALEKVKARNGDGEF
jgi:hypothetical protein